MTDAEQVKKNKLLRCMIQNTSNFSNSLNACNILLWCMGMSRIFQEYQLLQDLICFLDLHTEVLKE